ncbi:MAG: carboxypeptidase-like regulatory domain-containing protein, partial [Paramuribaculum sp.]|nr:carboxypeptidase-like regulatory domain-containing protein [Paramuribaculum sp.]
MLKPINSVGKLLLTAALLGTGACPAIMHAEQPALAQAAASTASGVVYDDMDEPMIGASVVVVNNPAMGAATNLDGEFSIKNVKIGTKLRITAVGYQPVEVVWQGQPISVKLET